MQPAARYAAAIDILDDIFAGAPAEKVLTTWARGHRFAGSKDRAAIRDHVFDALRMRRSCAALGEAETGRAVVIGLCLRQGIDPATVFTGQGHAPAPLSATEQARLPVDPAGALAGFAPAVRLDVPDWVFPLLQARFGAETEAILARHSQRAPVFLRVNTLKATRAQAQAALARDGVETIPVDKMNIALEVIANERKIRSSTAFQSGLVELQDLSSQRSVSRLALPKSARILDYCAGGGGKTLALAAHPDRPAALFAHDVAPDRMRDLPARASRAGATVELIDAGGATDHAPFDLVFVDAPCSGSGTWRRMPDAKWRLTPDDLDRYTRLQAQVLAQAAPHVAPGGMLCYTTCALFEAENETQVSKFLDSQPGWALQDQWRADLATGGDGFFCASMRRI